MAKLDIILGPMFAGKSTELIRRIRQLRVLGKTFTSIKPKIDDRYSNKEIVSHNNDRAFCGCYNSVNEFITTYNCKDLHTIFIEEGQFFPDLKNGVLQLVEKLDCNVVVVGLDGDSNRNKFGEILDLIPYCDSCIKLSALCKRCNDGTLAIFSHRNSKSCKQIEVGVADYEALCRKHYLEKNI